LEPQHERPFDAISTLKAPENQPEYPELRPLSLPKPRRRLPLRAFFTGLLKAYERRAPPAASVC